MSLDQNRAKKYSILDKDKSHSSRDLSWYFYFTKADLFKISKEIVRFLHRKIGEPHQTRWASSTTTLRS